MIKKVQNLRLQVDFIKEGDTYIAYSSALDISTCGDTFLKAQKSFEKLVQIFFAELIKMGTLDDVLSSLGWKKSKSNWMPPTVIAHQLQSVTLPVFA